MAEMFECELDPDPQFFAEPDDPPDPCRDGFIIFSRFPRHYIQKRNPQPDPDIIPSRRGKAGQPFLISGPDGFFRTAFTVPEKQMLHPTGIQVFPDSSAK